jgi:hypothetical protein
MPLVHKKKIGNWSFETGDRVIKRFAGCRAKSYAIDVQDDEPIVKSKGIDKRVVKTFSFEDYYQSVMHKKNLYTFLTRFRTKKLTIYTNKICKLSLNSADDKRYLLPDRISTLAWYHHQIEQLEKEKKEKQS